MVQLSKLTAKDLIEELKYNLDKYSWTDLFYVLDLEISPLINVIVRAAIHAKERDKSFRLTLESSKSRVTKIQNSQRKNFVRRTFKKWGLFSMQEIVKLYPDYHEYMLPLDLKIKRKKAKEKSLNPRNDFRARQLAKYEEAYHTTDRSSKEFNKICERIASLTHADLKKAPIYLTVILSKEKYLYSFPWNTTEREIKEFHLLANKVGMTHEQLCQYLGLYTKTNV